MHATLAERLASRDGWVALVGDSAHQFPPSGGFGVNVGLSEVDNLAYKLFAQGCNAGSVQAYSEQRHPIARESLRVAMDNYHRGLKPARALGLERKAVSVLSQLADRFIPGGARTKTGVMRRVAQAPVQLVLERPASVEALRRTVEVDKAALPMYFPQVDLGVDYDKRCLDARLGILKKGRLIKHAWLFVPTLGRTVSSMELTSPFFDGVDAEPTNQTIFVYNVDEWKKQEGEQIGRANRLVILTEASPTEHEEKTIRERFAGRKCVIAVDKGHALLSNLDKNVVGVAVDGTGFVSRIYRYSPKLDEYVSRTEIGAQ